MDKVLLSAKERLLSFGYVLKDGDEALLSLATERVEASIKNECGRTDIPDGLVEVAADMAVGQFLGVKKVFSPEDIAILADISVVKSVSVGDTSVSFDVDENSSSEARLDMLISSLLNNRKGEIACYRKIRW